MTSWGIVKVIQRVVLKAWSEECGGDGLLECVQGAPVVGAGGFSRSGLAGQGRPSSRPRPPSRRGPGRRRARASPPACGTPPEPPPRQGTGPRPGAARALPVPGVGHCLQEFP